MTYPHVMFDDKNAGLKTNEEVQTDLCSEFSYIDASLEIFLNLCID
jgi:hypothetical protein